MTALISVLCFATVLLSSSRAFAENEAAKIIEFFRAEGVPNALFYVVSAVALLWFVRKSTNRLANRYNEWRLLMQQIDTVVRFTVYIGTFVLVINAVFVLDKNTLLALSATIGVTVGFAFKDLAASVLAGIIIIFDRPFQVGDRVTFGGQYGEITSIGLRSVRLVTLDDSVVTIPNNKFLTDLVVSGNAGALDMQIVMDFYVAQDTDVSQAKRIVLEAVRTSRFVFLEKPVVVLVKDMIHQNYLATQLRAKAYVLDVRYEKSFESDVTERVKRAFRSARIQPPLVWHHSPKIEVALENQAVEN